MTEQCVNCWHEIRPIAGSPGWWEHADTETISCPTAPDAPLTTARPRVRELRPCAFCGGPADSTAGTSDGRRHEPGCAYHSFF